MEKQPMSFMMSSITTEDPKLSPGRSVSPDLGISSDSGVSSPSSSNSSLFGSPEAQSRYYASLVNYGPGMFCTNGDLLRMYETAAASIGLKNSVIQSNVLQAISLANDTYLRPNENYRGLDLSPPQTEKLQLKKDHGTEDIRKDGDKKYNLNEEKNSPKSQLDDSGVYSRLHSIESSPSLVDGLPEPAHLPLRYTCAEASLPLLRPVDLSIIQTPHETEYMNPRKEQDIADAKKNLFTLSPVTPLEIRTDSGSSSDSGRESVSPRSSESPKCIREIPCENVQQLPEKPPHSYIAMISMAILSTPEQKMILGGIYKYISDRFPFYNNKNRSWRNSVRHNLSLNECFIKIGRASSAKGFYWGIHPACVEDFSKGDFRRRQARRRARRNVHDLQLNNLANLNPLDLRSEKGYIPMSSAPLHSYHHINNKYHPYSRPVRPLPTGNPAHFYSCAPGFAPPAPPSAAPPVTWYQPAPISNHPLLPAPMTSMANHPILTESPNMYYPHLSHVSNVNFSSCVGSQLS